MWKAYLQSFFQKYDYPAEGAAALLETLDAVCRHEQMAAVMKQVISDYENLEVPTTEDVRALLERVRQNLQPCGLQSEATELLLFLLLCPRLECIYRQQGLAEDWFAGVAYDLRAKLNECYALRGIWGSFVCDWFCRFFSLGRFAIGRLQYELTSIPESYCPADFAYMAGQPAVNIHIPSGRPLIQSEIRESMAEAAAFFAPRFPEGKVLFMCYSWLLFQGHLEMLPRSSGIRTFMEEFSIINSDEDPSMHDMQRIFNTDNMQDLDALPQNTSLQRAYVQWLKKGKAVGRGLGIRYIQV